MLADPEERRRQRREQALQRQQAAIQQKKLLIGLGIAFAVLLAVALLILLAAGAFSDPQQSTEPPETAPQASPSTAEAPTQAATEPPSSPTTTIHLAAAGDLNITDRVAVLDVTPGGYNQAFLDVAHLLADADLSILNLEGGLCGAPYGSDTASAPQALVQALAQAGVDYCQLANSYSINHGISGLNATIDAVRAAGIEPLGVYANEGAYQKGRGYVIHEVAGIRIGLTAFTKGMDGMALPPGSEHCVNVLYSDYSSNYQTVDEAGISRILDAMNSEKPDLTVVMLHWGSEFNDTISSTQEEIVRLLRKKGVDAIIGTHPHYVQKMELDPDSGEFIAYSLGDFFGDADRAGSEYSVILDLEITKNNQTGKTAITDFSYTPIFTVSDETYLRVVRIEQAMAAYNAGYFQRVSPETFAAMEYGLGRAHARVAGE